MLPPGPAVEPVFPILKTPEGLISYGIFRNLQRFFEKRRFFQVWTVRYEAPTQRLADIPEAGLGSCSDNLTEGRADIALLVRLRSALVGWSQRGLFAAARPPGADAIAPPSKGKTQRALDAPDKSR